MPGGGCPDGEGDDDARGRIFLSGIADAVPVALGGIRRRIAHCRLESGASRRYRGPGLHRAKRRRLRSDRAADRGVGRGYSRVPGSRERDGGAADLSGCAVGGSDVIPAADEGTTGVPGPARGAPGPSGDRICHPAGDCLETERRPGGAGSRRRLPAVGHRHHGDGGRPGAAAAVGASPVRLLGREAGSGSEAGRGPVRCYGLRYGISGRGPTGAMRRECPSSSWAISTGA